MNAQEYLASKGYVAQSQPNGTGINLFKLEGDKAVGEPVVSLTAEELQAVPTKEETIILINKKLGL